MRYSSSLGQWVPITNHVQEALIGTVNGTNATFTVAHTPIAGTVVVTENGLGLQAGVDYNIQTDGSILFVPAAIPQPGDVLLASYTN
jgi:flagellar biosynthesis protein FliR